MMKTAVISKLNKKGYIFRPGPRQPTWFNFIPEWKNNHIHDKGGKNLLIRKRTSDFIPLFTGNVIICPLWVNPC